MEQMTPEQLTFYERKNENTAKTTNEFFEKNGYLVFKNICDVKSLICKPPLDRGTIEYWGKKENENRKHAEEKQVPGSLARYWYPAYQHIHSEIRNKIEKKIGKKLYNTYYYDRFYFPGQALGRHVDRDACEISVTVHVGSTLFGQKTNWPIWVKTPDIFKDKQKTELEQKGVETSVLLQPGDGLIYKGCERPHWRDPMPDNTFLEKLFSGFKNVYYHQVFFHYVLQDGERAHCAFDAAR